MWKPRERILHRPAPGPWPNVEKARNAHLFQPVRIGPLTLAQRTWVPAMVPWRASSDGAVTPKVLDWYARFAQGQPGGLVVEATGIRDIPSGPLLRIGDDRFVEGLAKLVETVREASNGRTRLFIQLIDFLNIRRRPEPGIFFEKYLEITPAHRDALGALDQSEAHIAAHLARLPERELERVLTVRELETLRMGLRERVTDTGLPHIAALPETLPPLFADAAARAREAGFDGVELHYAHAYTMASFLSALNGRKDGYGGPKENRARLPLEVYAAVRGALGDDFAIGCRFLSQECIAGGSGLEDSVYFGVEFARAGFDYLSLSRGGKFEDAKQPGIGHAAYPYTGPSGYECMPAHISDRQGPFGRNVEPAGAIRRAVRAAGRTAPIILAGGIHGFEQAEAILRRGQADIIAAARQSLADPDWFKKMRAGRGSEIRTCEYTNYCEGLDQKHKLVTCKLWDRKDLDAPDAALSDDGKRRLTAPAWEPNINPADEADD